MDLKPGLEYSHGQQQYKEPSWRPVSLPIHELYPIYAGYIHFLGASVGPWYIWVFPVTLGAFIRV